MLIPRVIIILYPAFIGFDFEWSLDTAEVSASVTRKQEGSKGV